MNKNSDQFYTKEVISQKCIHFLKKYINLKDFFVIEPSGGTGAFVKYIDKNDFISFDIEPKYPNIVKKDFLKVDLLKEVKTDKPILSLGNPPFGKNASLAIKFFNHCSLVSDYIAFIVPLSFNTHSIENRLNPHFHNIANLEIDFNAFIFKNKEHSVPTIFKIYKRENYKREIKKVEYIKELDFVKDHKEADIIIRRVGVKAGYISNTKSPSSNYFLKCSEKIKKIITENQEKLNLLAKSKGVMPSLSKYELIEFVKKLKS